MVDEGIEGQYERLSVPLRTAACCPWVSRLWQKPEGTHSLGWLETAECVVVETLSDVARMVDELMAGPIPAYDTETTGLRAVDDDIVSMQFSGDGTRAFFLPIGMLDPSFMNLNAAQTVALLTPVWERGVICHSAKFDWKMTMPLGVDFRIEACTQIECKMYDVHRSASLKDCMKDLLQLDEVIKFKDLFPRTVKADQRRFDAVERDKAVPYGSQDPLGTWRLHQWFLAHG